jgi:hypothetical protein
MAIGEKVTKKNGNGGEQTDAKGINPELRASMFADEAPANWHDTGSKYLYKPEMWVANSEGGLKKCYRVDGGGKRHSTAPLIVGVPAGIEHREDPNNGPYIQIYVRLTKPCLVLMGEHNEEFVVPAGAMIMVTQTDQLSRVAELALDPQFETEVAMRPIQQEKIVKNNRTIWRWDIHENPVRTPRAQLPAAPTQDLPSQLQS